MPVNIENLSPQLIVALITAILTAAVTLLSVYLSGLEQRKRDQAKFEIEKNQQREKIKRLKLEELYILFSKWEADISSLYMLFLPVIAGRMAEKDALDTANKNKLSEMGAFQRIDMIVHLYFPELIEQLNVVLKSRDAVSRFIGENRPKDNNDKEFLQAQRFFKKTANEFMHKIADIAGAL